MGKRPVLVWVAGWCLLVLLASARWTQAQFSWEQLQAVYAYDASRPLDAQEQEPSVTGALQSQHISFSGADGERVPAMLYRPVGEERPPCVLFLHGYGGKKEHGQLAASLLVPQGLAVMAIDARLHGERAEPGKSLLSPESLADGRPLVNTVIDNRRAIDYLGSRQDLDAERLTVLGVSMGGILGAVLAAVDERVDAAALLVAGGRWDLVVADSQHPSAQSIRELGLSSDQIRQVTATIDPVNFVGHIAPRPLLMVNGDKDEIIPRACAEALHAAAGEPKQVIWYQGGHVNVPLDVINTVLQWLVTQTRTAPGVPAGAG